MLGSDSGGLAAAAADGDPSARPPPSAQPMTIYTSWPSTQPVEPIFIGDRVVSRSTLQELTVRQEKRGDDGTKLLVCLPASDNSAESDPVELPKSDVKIAVAAGDEVFFRPSMMFKAYDIGQDWPRGVVKDIRPDGVVVIESWSWRLANGRGATVFSQWSDVRRAPSRTKNQMLPEQRVWRAEERKKDAQTLFIAAGKDLEPLL